MEISFPSRTMGSATRSLTFQEVLDVLLVYPSLRIYFSELWCSHRMLTFNPHPFPQMVLPMLGGWEGCPGSWLLTLPTPLPQPL